MSQSSEIAQIHQQFEKLIKELRESKFKVWAPWRIFRLIRATHEALTLMLACTSGVLQNMDELSTAIELQAAEAVQSDQRIRNAWEGVYAEGSKREELEGQLGELEQRLERVEENTTKRPGERE